VDSDADQSVLEEIFFDRDYFRIEERIASAKRGILDVGAHKGFFVLYARGFNPTVPIFAYEPEEGNFQALKRHLVENRVQGVVAKNLALAGQEGSVALHLSEDSHNHTLLPVLPSFNEKKVNAVLLANVLKKMGGGAGGREGAGEGEEDDLLAGEDFGSGAVLPAERVLAGDGFVADAGFEDDIGDALGDFESRHSRKIRV
jgi:FkbM family methyltransferase